MRRRVEVRFEMGFPTLGIVDDMWSSMQVIRLDKIGRLKKMYGPDAEKSRCKRRPPRMPRPLRMAHAPSGT